MSTTIRTPSLSVTLNAAPLNDLISARVEAGFNLRVAEAEVVLRALPAGIMPWDEIEITMGGTVGTAAVRFTGYFMAAENQLYSKETKLICKGKLSRAEWMIANTNVDMSTFPGNPGHHDETMVATVLYICNLLPAGTITGEVLSGDAAFIEGTGQLLGHYAWDWGFEWSRGETGLSFIEKLDEVCLGYRTYDTFDGTIKRTQITCFPKVAPDFTFTEHVDIYRATESTTIWDAKNEVVVEGFPGKDGKTPIEYTAQGGNPYLYYFEDGSQMFHTLKLSSPMIEFETDADKVPTYGLSCQEVANWLLHENNVYHEEVILTTPRDDVIEPGDTIAVASPTRLGVSRNFWVQEVDVEINRSGAFSQVLTCVTGVPIYQAYIAAPAVVGITIPAVTATYLSELSAAVAPAIVQVTIPAVTATYVYAVSAAVAPLAVGVTIPAVTATHVSELSAVVAPLVVNVTIPAVTTTYVGNLTAAVVPLVVNVTIPAVTATWVYETSAAVAPLAVAITIPAVTAHADYMLLLETGDVILLETGDKMLMEG